MTISMSSAYLLSAGVALFTGLDRTAAMQFMISRPIVAAPLTGCLLGEPFVGLQAGALIELLWLGRLPVGAAIPPDDTQVAVAGTVLTITMGERLGFVGLPFLLLCILITLPLGKIGQVFDHLARSRNGRLLIEAEQALETGDWPRVDRCHLRGLAHFALSSLASFALIILGGSLALYFLGPLMIEPVTAAAGRLNLALPLIGVAMILGTINVRRAGSLFGASFAAVLLVLWAVR